jgi:hypothetical protein
VSLADTIHAILTEEVQTSPDPDWNGIDPASIESATARLVALFGDQYEWGIRKTWSAEMGGHTEDEIRGSEQDARDRVTDWKWRPSQYKPSRASTRITSLQLIRRMVGPWEVVES